MRVPGMRLRDAMLVLTLFVYPIYCSAGNAHRNVFYLQQLPTCDVETTFFDYVLGLNVLSFKTVETLSHVIQSASQLLIYDRDAEYNSALESIEVDLPMKELSIQQRRDFVVSVLSLSFYRNRTESVEDAENLMVYPVSLVYVKQLQLDVIDNSLLPDDALFHLAEKLPCVSLDRELGPKYFPLHYLLPNDPLIAPSEDDPVGTWYLGGPHVPSLQQNYGARVLEAWAITRGSTAPSIRIAVIGPGCSSHPDLEANYVNQSAARVGYDFTVVPRGSPFVETLTKPFGTPIVGMIAATPNNLFGGAGVCWGCPVMCLKVYDATGVLSSDAVVKALEYIATEPSIKIVYLGYTSSQYFVREAMLLEKLSQQGVLLISPAGDEGCDVEPTAKNVSPHCRSPETGGSITIHPALYNLSSVLVVGASTPVGDVASFSNWAASAVDLFAPGTNIVLPSNSVAYKALHSSFSGTSCAAALVAGIAGIVWSSKPELTAAELKTVLVETVTHVPSLTGKSVSGGIVNALAAVQLVDGKKELFEPASNHIPKTDMTPTFYSHTSDAFTQTLTLLFVLAFSLWLHIL